jgi:TetR/AcrR family transcriptional regulator, repressor for uid operon
VTDLHLVEVVGGATTGSRIDEASDRTSRRILDAALTEAASVGLQRITVEDVVRRAGVSRMTAYRRYPRRDDLVAALARRETQRFLGAVADAIERAEDPRAGVAEAFIAAVAFARTSDSSQGLAQRACADRGLRGAVENGLGVHRQLHPRR